MTAWNLPETAIRAVLQRLDDLSHHPSRYLIRVRTPTDDLASDIVVHDVDSPPRDLYIILSVRYGVDEQTLYVVTCDCLIEDRLDQRRLLRRVAGVAARRNPGPRLGNRGPRTDPCHSERPHSRRADFGLTTLAPKGRQS